MYSAFIKPILFLLPPEKAHNVAITLFKLLLRIPGGNKIVKLLYGFNHPSLRRTVFGIDFPNPVGLAAGFDKDGKYYNVMSKVGFGFIEIGTVTPKPQSGNPQPRLFRLKKDHALINRMGFNNDGVEAMVSRLKNRSKHDLIIGGNIGKNKDTPNENATSDYEFCFKALHPYVDYFVVNVSSPNTPGLRDLQDKEPLSALLSHIMALNKELAVPKPILLKIAPDLTDSQLDDIIEIVAITKINGVIATNTTISRSDLTEDVTSIGNGGLSGRPLANRSTEVIRYLSQKSNGTFPIIGVGGIHSAQDAIEKLNAGASLVQVYTGFIYEGPGLIKAINRKISQM